MSGNQAASSTSGFAWWTLETSTGQQLQSRTLEAGSSIAESSARASRTCFLLIPTATKSKSGSSSRRTLAGSTACSFSDPICLSELIDVLLAADAHIQNTMRKENHQ